MDAINDLTYRYYTTDEYNKKAYNNKYDYAKYGILTKCLPKVLFKGNPILVSFIPMIMGTGGNCGSQSSTLVIRGLAVDEIKPKDFLKVWWKEIRVAMIVGIIMAIVNCIRILIQYHDLQLGIVVGLTLVITIGIAKSLGCLLPLICKKLKLDPAIMAAPLISTILDTCSCLVFFNVAVMIMGL